MSKQVINEEWNRSKPGYRAVHSWIQRTLGKPLSCCNCGESSKTIEWANKDHLYGSNLTDYKPLCSKCHKAYDRSGQLIKKWDSFDTMSSKTDNDPIGFSYKVALRCETANNNQSVLDCYHGHGFIWNAVMKETGHSINITPIDTRKDKTKAYLRGNNIQYLKSMNLDRFDVIDLDAYGVPFDQLEVLFKRQYRGIVHLTFIQSGMGRLNNKLLDALGYMPSMVKKCRTLLERDGYEKFKNYLSIRNILNMNELSLNRKHYLYFNLKL